MGFELALLMARKYIAGIKSRLWCDLMRLSNRLYPLLSKFLTDFSTFQSHWVKNILYIPPYTPPPCQLLVGLKSR
jgi:hypothetical protein